MGRHYATIDMGWKVGADVPFFWGGDRRKPKQLQGTSTDVLNADVIASLIITLEGKRWA